MKFFLPISIFLFCMARFANAQSNLLTNSSFEDLPVNSSSYMTTGNGSLTGSASKQWHLAFVGNNFPTCSNQSCGTTNIDTAFKNTGSKSLRINITKHTNRNDIRLFQFIDTVKVAGQYVLKLFVRSDVAGYPFTINIFKSTEAMNSNGICTVASPCQSYTTTTGWKQYKMYVDLSTWTTAERDRMRISIRPNTNTATPTGPYPKVFWFDDITFQVVNPAVELKETAIDVIRERQQMALDSGFTAEANALENDIAVISNSTTTLPVVPKKALGFNPVPTQTTALTNPYIAALESWAATYLTQTFVPFKKSTKNSVVFPKSYDTRTLGEVLENLHWLVVSPLSKYQNNLELFRRFLHIVYATSDDYVMNGGGDISATAGFTNNSINDWFAAPKICYAWMMADTSFSQYIPQTLITKMRQAADTMGLRFNTLGEIEVDSFLYTNRDISYAEALVQAGVYRNNSTWINLGKRIVDSVHLVGLFPDGAYCYRKMQNEVTNYHGGTNNSLAKIWSMIEYQPALDCIAKSWMFEILSIEKKDVGEFYTAGAWKTMWNGSSGFSAEPLLAVSQNPYLKTKFAEFRAAYGFREEMVLSLAYYNPNISSQPLPSNYVVYDRNIQGPRARYGNFSYGATTRVVSYPGMREPGLQTVIGAMQTKASSDTNIDELDAALMAVHSKVHVRKTTNNTQWTDWGYMLTNTNGKVCVGRTASTVSASGILQYQTSGPNAFETNWSSYQQWITLPDRVIGIVETYPTNNVATQAFEIDGRVRFTYGRAAVVNPKYMVTEVAGSRYAYGKFKTIIHNHDFTTVSVDTAGIVRDDFRNSMEIIFRYDLSNGNTLYSYPGNTKKYFIVEIRDSAAVGNATVTRVNTASVKGLVVQLNGKAYASYRNDGNATNIALGNAFINGNTHQVLFSRGDSITKLPVNITASNYTIPANEQVLIISTNTPSSDTGKGWQNYPQLLAANNNYNNRVVTLPVVLNSFSAATSNCTTSLNWQTSKETGVKAFVVEQSVDGVNFTPIDTQLAKCNNQNANCNYTSKIQQLLPLAFYRLKMIDVDGSVNYSKIVSAKNNCNSSSQLILLANPVQNNNVRFMLDKVISEKMQVSLVTQDGKLIHQSVLAPNNSVYNFVVPASTAKGNYILRVKSSQLNEVKSITIQ